MDVQLISTSKSWVRITTKRKKEKEKLKNLKKLSLVELEEEKKENLKPKPTEETRKVVRKSTKKIPDKVQ